MERKKIGLFILLLGALLLLYTLFLDVLQGEALRIGRSQLLLAGVFVLVMLFGIALLLPPLRRLPDPWRWLTRAEGLLARLSLPHLTPRAADALVLIGFALFAILYTLGRWKGLHPFIFLGSDASYISSYAAALDHPGAFAADYIFQNSAKVDIYFAAHVPLIRLLSRLNGDYGSAFLTLLPIVLFLKLLGFYLLGKALFRHRGYALLLAVLTFPVIYTGAWDYWGLLDDALPRNLVEIAFPFLLLWSVRHAGRLRYWYLTCAVLSALIYVHSISSLPLLIAFGAVFLFLAPLPWRKRLLHLVLGGLVYLAAAMPFFLNALSSTQAVVTVPLTPQEHLDLMMRYFGSHVDIPAILLSLLKQLTLSGILPLALAALGYLLLRPNPQARRLASYLGVMLLTVLAVALLLPWLEQFVELRLNILAELMQLVRFIRYVPPLLMIFSLLVFAVKPAEPAQPSALPRLTSLTFVLMAALVFAGMLRFNAQGGHALAEVRCLASGHLLCPTEREQAAIDIVQHAADLTTPADALLTLPPLQVEFELALRWQALRPLGLNVPDLSRMRDDLGRLVELKQVIAPWSAVAHADPPDRLPAYLQLAPQVGARFLIVQLADFPARSLTLLHPLYQNAWYALVPVNP